MKKSRLVMVGNGMAGVRSLEELLKIAPDLSETELDAIAEVLLAPLGVSLITRLAPPHKTAQAVGLWFASSAVGNGLAALLALGWDRWPHHRYFAVLAILSLGAAAALMRRRSASV